MVEYRANIFYGVDFQAMVSGIENWMNYLAEEGFVLSSMAQDSNLRDQSMEGMGLTSYLTCVVVMERRTE